MEDHIQNIISKLEKKSAYSEEFESEVKVIQTAISVVFLAGENAYKVSKPVNFGFLDFTTLEKRKDCYDKEVEFNSLISPELYRGVVPIIKREDGSFFVAEEGKVLESGEEIIEYAIKMKRCNPDNVMKEILKSGEVSSEKIVELAKIIADFHKKAPMSEEISSYGKMEMVRLNLIENFDQTESVAGKWISSEDFASMKNKVEQFLEKNSELIASRVSNGHIKHCHGDLHSGNIFIDNGKILVFDGIVFNKRFPNSDTISDLATILTDLEILGHEEHAKLLLETYQKEIGDNDMEVLLPLYILYKAHVRAKVQSFIFADPNVATEAKEAIAAEGKKYFEFALKYAERLGL